MISKRMLTVSALVILLSAADQAYAQNARQAGRSRKPHIVVGQKAVDFELPLLAFETDGDGEDVAVISTNTVKLSSFRGKKVACIFFSSYT